MSQLQPVLTFDGIDDYIEVPYSEKHYPQAFTLSCWVKAPETIGGYLVCTFYGARGGNRGYALSIERDCYYIRIYTHSGGNSLKPSFNIWTHVASTFEGGKTKIYVNGQTPVEFTLPTQVVNGSIPLLIGAGYTPTTLLPNYFFRGQIAEVCIWNKARTQQEILSDMNQRLTGKEVGLVGYWPLNEGSGNIVIDKTGNSNGIIKGGATWTQEEIPVKPPEPTSGEVQISSDSSTGVEFTNKLMKDSSYKFIPSGIWKTTFEDQERTAAGVKGFPPEVQTQYSEELKPYQQDLKYPNNTYLALVAVNKTTGVVTEVTQETTIVLKAGETLTFLVNYFPTKYENNTGTLIVKWSAT